LNFKSDIENEKQKVRLLSRIVFLSFLVMIIQTISLAGIQKDFTIHIPPDLRSGITKNIKDIDEYNVYLFAQYLLQQLNNWETNGAVDFPNQVNKLSAFLTPSYQQTLKSHIIENLNGELRNRVRLFKPISGSSFDENDVEVVGDSWIIWLDVNIVETVHGLPVKTMMLRYPIKVVRYDTNREGNPWQLALDGHGGYKEQRIINEYAGIKK